MEESKETAADEAAETQAEQQAEAEAGTEMPIETDVPEELPVIDTPTDTNVVVDAPASDIVASTEVLPIRPEFHAYSDTYDKLLDWDGKSPLTSDHKLALAHAQIKDLKAQQDYHAEQMQSLQKSLDAIQKSAKPIDNMSTNPDTAMKQAMTYQSQASNAAAEGQKAIASQQIGDMQAVQQQRDDIYQQTYREQQQYANQIKQLGDQYPNTTYDAIEKNMSATNTAMKYAAFAFGAMGAAFNGGHNTGVESYYKALDKTIETNNFEYKKQMDRNNTTHGSSLEGLQLKLGATTDRMNMLNQQYAAMSKTFETTMQNAQTQGQIAQASAGWWYTKKNYELALRKTQMEEQQLAFQYQSQLIKSYASPNQVTIIDPYTGKQTQTYAKDDKARENLDQLPKMETEIKDIQEMLATVAGKPVVAPGSKIDPVTGKFTEGGIAYPAKADKTGFGNASELSDSQLEAVRIKAAELFPHVNDFKESGSNGINPTRSALTPGYLEGERQQQFVNFLQQELQKRQQMYNRIVQQNSYNPGQLQNMYQLNTRMMGAIK